MVKCKFIEVEAIIQDGVWKSEDKILERLLNTTRFPDHRSPSIPDPDRAVAEEATHRLHGEILKADTPVHEDGVVY